MNPTDFSGYVSSGVILTCILVAATIVTAVAALARRPAASNCDAANAVPRAAVGRAVAVVAGGAVFAAVAATGLVRGQAAWVGLVVVAGLAVSGYALAAWTETGRRVLDAVPQSWLIGVQAYRTVGAVFFIVAAEGGLPAYFAIPAGAGDFVTGVGAPLVALWWAVGYRFARPAAWAWNVFGMLDLVVAVGIGSSLLAAPAAARFGGAPEWLERAALGFQPFAPAIFPFGAPLTLIPTFLVPIALVLHALSLRKLVLERSRRAEPEATGLAALPRPVAPAA